MEMVSWRVAVWKSSETGAWKEAKDLVWVCEEDEDEDKDENEDENEIQSRVNYFDLLI